MTLPTPPNYEGFTNDRLRIFLAKNEKLSKRLGGDSNAWEISEIGDGNLNYVFLIKGKDDILVVKQALPYMRTVGESWPLPLNRAYFEGLGIQTQMKFTPKFVPNVIHYDNEKYCNVMEYFRSLIIIRKGMLQGIKYPKFADDIADYLASSLFFTSDIAMPPEDKRKLIATFSNNYELLETTENVIFKLIFTTSDNNRWTTPYLDSYAKKIREDQEARIAITNLKYLFQNSTQSLIHSDLHTGSIMVSENETKVIDFEFMLFGPMGLDTGKLMANFILCYYALAAYENIDEDYRQWVLDTTIEIWDKFNSKFLALWENDDNRNGSLFNKEFFPSLDDFAEQRKKYMQDLWQDTLQFCGACILRRIVGHYHNLDFTNIKDAKQRATCEAKALELGMELIKTSAGEISSSDELRAKILQFDKFDPKF